MGPPLSQSLIQSYFLRPQTSLRFYLRSCTYAMLLMYLNCARSTLYCLGLVTRLRGIDSPRLGICCRLPPAPQTLGPSRSLLTSLRVYFKGWPPEIFLNPVIVQS